MDVESVLKSKVFHRFDYCALVAGAGFRTTVAVLHSHDRAVLVDEVAVACYHSGIVAVVGDEGVDSRLGLDLSHYSCSHAAVADGEEGLQNS
jgi:hypothetical protein